MKLFMMTALALVLAGPIYAEGGKVGDGGGVGDGPREPKDPKPEPKDPKPEPKDPKPEPRTKLRQSGNDRDEVCIPWAMRQEADYKRCCLVNRSTIRVTPKTLDAIADCKADAEWLRLNYMLGN